MKEFAYDNSFHSGIKMAPFKALYRCGDVELQFVGKKLVKFMVLNLKKR